jgi:ATP-dependent helicase HepA
VSEWLRKLVLVHTDPRLFGKVVADHGDAMDIEFFRSVADRELQRLPRSSVTHAALPMQTRVFVELEPGFWRVGRVVDKYKSDTGSFSYSIKFPNEETSERPEEACFVRCLDRYADPSRILAAGCIETQYFADRRRSALRRLRDLRSAAQGLVGVLSASVELLPHQVATVRRVVTDRTIRYLLADEVGLGKTVEAGLIIRQLLLDNINLAVEIFVPSTLVEQWKDELDSKCFLTDNDVSVRAHEEMARISLPRSPGLLVVDEAHRLIVPAGSEGQSASYERLRQLAHEVPRLLLLSATPALGDEARLLALLNLLDPISYPLDQLEAFRARVMARQPIGRLLLAMRPGAAAFSLHQQARRACEMFPDDIAVREEADRLLQSGDNQSERDAAAVALKDHIANTYRIHQRLIRARRADVEKWTMRPRGPAWPAMTHIRLRFSGDAHAEGALEALEAWRDSATRASANDDVLTVRLARRWFTLIEAAWRGGRELSIAARGLAPMFEAEADGLEELARLGDVRALTEDRYTVASTLARDWLRDLGWDASGRPKKLVCFASAPTDAARLVEQLQKELGRGQVISIVNLGNDTGYAVKEFSASGTIKIAVCDRFAEEGINLQFVHGIIHMDLPFDAARVEQRVGRLDRFGRRIDRIEHRIFMPSDSDLSPWRTWFSLLANGFQVFNRSISDVQIRIQSLEREISLRMFREGAHKIEELAEHVAAQLTEEREKLDEQHALDGLSQLIDVGDELVQAIEASEEDEAGLAADVEPWIRNVLALQVEPVGPADAQAIQITWGSDTLLPGIPWRSILEPALHQRWTWRRRQSLKQRVPPSALLRPGAPLIEVLERIALWDDRGIAYATWRVEPAWQGIWRGCRLVWLVEPALDTDTPVYSPARPSDLARRAEAFLPAMTVEQYVSEDGTVVKEAGLLEILSRPYQQQRGAFGRGDFNLGSRPEALLDVIGRSEFVALVEQVTARGREALWDTPKVRVALAAAREACERDSRRARRGLETRAALSAVHPGMVERPLPEELADLTSLLHAVREPGIRLDEIGFVVIAAAAPA